MQLTRTTHSHSHSPDDRQITTTRRLRRRRSHIRTRSGSLGQSHHQRRRRSGSSYSTSSSSSSSSGDEHHHRGKEIGATLVGAAGGGALAKEVLGGGKLATLGGAVAGAVAANALEKRHERYLFPSSIVFFERSCFIIAIQRTHIPIPPRSVLETPHLPGEKMKLTSCSIFMKNFRHKDERRSGFSDREYPDNSRHHHHHHHRSSLDPREIKDEIKEKLTDFLSPGNHHESGKRDRSYSGGSRRSSRR